MTDIESARVSDVVGTALSAAIARFDANEPALWTELDRDKRERAWKTMDSLNATLGRDTVRLLSAGPKAAAWKLRAEHRSPRWTTRWDQLPKVRAV